MSDLFQEVDNAIKQEKIHEFWRKNGHFIVIAVLALIIGTAGYSAYTSWNESGNAKATETLMQAIVDENSMAALQEIAGDTRDGQRAIALLTAGGLAQAENNIEKAKELFYQLADSGGPRTLRDLAMIKAVSLETLTAETAPEAIKKLTPIMDDANPWRYHARVNAALAHAAAGDYDRARTVLEPVIKSPGAPRMVRDYALKMDEVYRLQSSPSSTEPVAIQE